MGRSATEVPPQVPLLGPALHRGLPYPGTIRRWQWLLHRLALRVRRPEVRQDRPRLLVCERLVGTHDPWQQIRRRLYGVAEFPLPRPDVHRHEHLGQSITHYISKWANFWIRDVLLQFSSNPSAKGAGGPNQNTSRIGIIKKGTRILFMIHTAFQACPSGTSLDDCANATSWDDAEAKGYPNLLRAL